MSSRPRLMSNLFCTNEPTDVVEFLGRAVEAARLVNALDTTQQADVLCEDCAALPEPPEER
jgi:hypothetical protein